MPVVERCAGQAARLLAFIPMTGGRVMIVDDEDEIRELCRVNLEFDNFEVLEAPDGPTALELAHGERVDLILLDLMMPGMDGW